MSATKYFDDGIRRVTGERGAVYGHPAVNFRRAAAMRAIVNECPDPVLREALGNITDKIARLIETPDHADSWLDIAGYARCGCMSIDHAAAMDQDNWYEKAREDLLKAVKADVADIMETGDAGQ